MTSMAAQLGAADVSEVKRALADVADVKRVLADELGRALGRTR